jgi:nucleoside 2-deoxyribosyltransferase
VTIYLAGPINACSDDEAFGWREKVTARLGAENVLDPMARDYRGAELENVAELVEADKADIEACDAVLAYCWKPSAGTSMEILWAWLGEQRVIAVVPADQPISPWIAHHAEVHRTLDEALDALTKGN